MIATSPFELDWGPWIPHRGCWTDTRVPKTAGLYRIRRVGQESLDYVGQTGGGSSNLRGRLSGQKNLYDSDRDMPFADPHTASPGLWAIRKVFQCEFEVSVAPVDLDDGTRKALECLVIAEHRQAFGRSPTVNFSRMPEGWSKSSGVSAAKRSLGKQFRGGACDHPTSHHATGIPPVAPLDTACSSPSWCGHQWSEWVEITALPRASLKESSGLYRIKGDGDGRLAYIGQGKVLMRLLSHQKESMLRSTAKGAAFANAGTLSASWTVNSTWSTLHLEELENDLIAAHLLATGMAPIAQFGGVSMKSKQP